MANKNNILIDIDVYKRVKRLLKEKWKQTKIAHMVGITQPMVHNIKASDSYTDFRLKGNIKLRRKGYLYLVKSGKYHKIGITTNISTRKKSYKTHNPIAMFLSYNKVNKAGFLEHELLSKYSNKRFRNDWFILDKDDIDFIKQVIDSGEIE